MFRATNIIIIYSLRCLFALASYRVLKIILIIFFTFLLRLELFGKNEVIVDVHSYWKLFFAEVMNPFYVFQIFSICLWFFDEYEYYAICVLISSTISIGTSLYQLKEVRIVFFFLSFVFESLGRLGVSQTA